MTTMHPAQRLLFCAIAITFPPSSAMHDKTPTTSLIPLDLKKLRLHSPDTDRDEVPNFAE